MNDFGFVLAVLDRAFVLRNHDALRRAELLLTRFVCDGVRMSRLPWGAMAAGVSIRRAEQIQSLIDKHKNLNLTNTDGPTPETLCQPTRLDPLTKLKLSGELTDHQVSIGRQIAEVYEAFTAALHAKGSRLDGAGRGVWRDDVTKWAADQYRERYKPWVQACRRKRLNVAMVVDIVVFSLAIRAARAKYRSGRSRIVRELRTALDYYGE